MAESGAGFGERKRRFGYPGPPRVKTAGRPAEFPIEENPFESLVVDITNRCDMRCGFCYNREPSGPDMRLDFFADFCARLPVPVYLKLSGGEPTLHPDLPEMIAAGARRGHTVYVASNGLRYADPAFLGGLRKVRTAGAGFSLGISLDGGTANRKAYEVINESDCLDRKIEALESLLGSGLGRLCLTALIVRGLNEDVIPQLVGLALRNPKAVRYLHFRNAALVGRWKKTAPYSMKELKELVGALFTGEEFARSCIGEVHCPPPDGRECCYRFRPTGRLQISLIEFASPRARACPRRGRLKNGATAIQPFFDSMF
jgi:molybdenum cofactor biosynthesis enzyme MoaA